MKIYMDALYHVDFTDGGFRHMRGQYLVNCLQRDAEVYKAGYTDPRLHLVKNFYKIPEKT